jgi:hypothetical protein
MVKSYDGLDMWLELKKCYLCAVLVRKPFDIIPLGKLRIRRKDDIKMWLIVIGCRDVK